MHVLDPADCRAIRLFPIGCSSRAAAWRGFGPGVGIALWLKSATVQSAPRECGGGHGPSLLVSVPWYPKRRSGLHSMAMAKGAAVLGRGNGHAPDRDRVGA